MKNKEVPASAQRVMDAVEFRGPDRLPRWDNFSMVDGWGVEFVQRWREWKGLAKDADPADYYGKDISTVIAEEGAFFRGSGLIEREGQYEIFRDSWGNLLRKRPGAYFAEPIQNVLDNPAELDGLEFDPASDDLRYDAYVKKMAAERNAGRLPFTKIGGIYCRSQFMRREDRLLMDMASDEGFCHALFARVAEHLTQIAINSLERTDSWEQGLWVYDDCANSNAPMFSPAMWEKYFLDNYKGMITTLRQRGCKHFFFHSDGNIGPLIDLLLEAGFEGFNPLEPRCGLDLVKLRECYGKRIVFFGGICNTQILPRGNKKEIEAHVRPLVELGAEGGLIIGSASIGDDISPQTYDYYISLLDKYGLYR